MNLEYRLSQLLIRSVQQNKQKIMGNKADRSDIDMVPTEELGKNPKVSSTRTPDSLLPPGMSDYEDLSGIIRQKMIKRRSTDQMRPSAAQSPLFEVREMTNSNNGSPKSSSPKKDTVLDSEACELDLEPEETQLSRGMQNVPVSTRQKTFVFRERHQNAEIGDEFEFGGNPSFVPITFKGSFATSIRQVGVSMKNLRVSQNGPVKQKPNDRLESQEFEYLPLIGDSTCVIRVDRHTHQLQSFCSGDLADGVPHGIGTLKYSETEFYAGSWSGGLAEGHGKLINSLLNYEGTFHQGKFSGQGVLTIEGKGTYEGRFLDGHFDGKGKFSWSCGGKMYVGTWKYSKFHGKGMMMWADGRKFCGEYQNGFKHGKGVCFFSSGKNIKGIWNNGRLLTSN